MKTLHTEAVSQREKTCHTSLTVRDHSLERIFSAGLMGKIVLISCSEETLAPHLQLLSEGHNLEPSARPQ